MIDAQHDFWPEDFARSFPDFPDRIARLLAELAELERLTTRVQRREDENKH
jgi:hypothetical protein